MTFNIGHVQGGTDAGWKKANLARYPGAWECPECNDVCKAYWVNCPNCSTPRPSA